MTNPVAHSACDLEVWFQGPTRIAAVVGAIVAAVEIAFLASVGLGGALLIWRLVTSVLAFALCWAPGRVWREPPPADCPGVALHAIGGAVLGIGAMTLSYLAWFAGVAVAMTMSETSRDFAFSFSMSMLAMLFMVVGWAIVPIYAWAGISITTMIRDMELSKATV